MLTIGVIVIVSGLIFSAYLLVGSQRHALTALAFAVITIAAGIGIINPTNMRHLGAEATNGKYSVGIDFAQAVQEVRETKQQVRTDKTQVQADTSEVRQIKDEIQALAKKVGQAD